MGFSYVKSKGETLAGIIEFSCDTEADVASLPVNGNIARPGSKATVIDTGNKYILNSELEWTLCGNSEGGGGDVLVVTFSLNLQNEIESDTSISEIMQAFDEEKTVIGKYVSAIYTLNHVQDDIVVFQWFDLFANRPNIRAIMGAIDNGEDAWRREEIYLSDSFVATYAITETDGAMSATCNKTYNEIKAAIDGGKTIICKTQGALSVQTSDAVIYETSIVFSISMIGEQSVTAVGLLHSTNDEISVYTPQG